MKTGISQPAAHAHSDSDVESQINALLRNRLLSQAQAGALMERLDECEEPQRVLKLANRLAHGRQGKRDQYVAVLRTIRQSLSDHSDTTACGMIHEYPGHTECPRHIRSKRIGCPHGYFQIKNAILALTRMCFIRNAKSHLQEINFLNESLGKMDDTLSGEGFYVDPDDIPKEQRLTIEAKDRMRRRVLEIVDIALGKIKQVPDPGGEFSITT